MSRITNKQIKTNVVPNIDTLITGIECSNYHSLIQVEYRNNLEAIMESMEKNCTDMTPIDINGRIFMLQSHGIKFYRYLLINENCFNIFMAKSPMPNNCPIRVEIRSEFLWKYGYIGAWSEVLKTLKDIGLYYESSKLTRVDLACHTDQFDINKIIGSTADFDKIKTKAKKRVRCNYNYEDRKDEGGQERRYVSITGIELGSRDNIFLRIYNKTRELEDKQNERKRRFFKEVVWKEHGLNPNHVYNIEFQIMRQALKSFETIEGELSSVEDLFQNINELWNYLTHNWFSFVDPTSDSNRTRQETLFEWAVISEVKFDKGKKQISEIGRNHTREIVQDIAINGITAYLSSLGACRGDFDLKRNTEFFLKRLKQQIINKEVDWNSKVERKLDRLQRERSKKKHELLKGSITICNDYPVAMFGY